MPALAMGGGLAAVLGEVWSSPLPLCERRRLAARVAVAALGTSSGSSGGGGGADVRGEDELSSSAPLGLMEEALLAVADLAGKGKVGISTAKAILRERGEEGVAVARRLGKLSKARNATAHPDVALLADIRSLPALPVGSSVVSEPDPECKQDLSYQQMRDLLVQAQKDAVSLLKVGHGFLMSTGGHSLSGGFFTAVVDFQRAIVNEVKAFDLEGAGRGG